MKHEQINLHFSFLLTASLFLFSCGQNGNSSSGNKDAATAEHDSLMKVIGTEESKITDKMHASVLDPTLAAQTLNNYELFAKKYPQDTNTAMFLFKAADLAGSAMRQYDKSASLLEMIIKDHPAFAKLPTCYFQLGVIYDDYLNDAAKAKAYYEQFIQKFPNNTLVPQVKVLISYLGKSNDELIKGFEQKNK